MGQAKLRGNFEERKANAEPKTERQQSPDRAFIRGHGVDKQEFNRSLLSARASGGKARLHNKTNN